MYFDDWQENRTSNNFDKETYSSLVAFFNESNKEELSRLAGEVSHEAKDFFDTNIVGLLGQLPEEMADTTMTLNKSALQQLLFSSMVTGYVAKSVEHKLSLEKLLNNPGKSSQKTLEDKLNKKPPFLS
tara:strand:- start:107 stop:490 length:384 start_codon:yes stop_codon:yes gene_type:complete